MATHNQVRLIGYLTKKPIVLNENKPGEEKILMNIKTARREADGYRGEYYCDVIVYYSGDELMPKFKTYDQFDIVDIKGVFMVLPTMRKSICPACGAINYKENAVSTFVYPQSVTRLGSYTEFYDNKLETPDSLLMKNYQENSNQCLIIGTVITDPQFIAGDVDLCRYGLGVDRKYYVKEQSEQHSDYPWVYSYGEQAEWDAKYLRKKSVILMDGFIHNEWYKADKACKACNHKYTVDEVGTQFTPYSIEYLSGYMTDETLQKEAELAKLAAMADK